MVSEIANFSKNLLLLKHMLKRLGTLKNSANWSTFWLDYCLLFSSLVIIWGALVYYLYALNRLGIIITIALTLLSFFPIKRLFFRKNDKIETTASADEKQKGLINYLKFNKITLVLALAYLTAVSLAFYRFFQARSDRALISPWSVINYDFFWLYILSALILGFLLVRAPIKNGLKLALISLYYFLSLSAAVIIYKIGYGFDPFIHQATMELIAAKGLVLPKTPYYLGEYSLIIIISKVSGLAIQFLNKFLVPFLTAVLLPAALFDFLKKQTKAPQEIFLTIIALLIFGVSPFIATTPQNLSYLFLLLAVLAAAASNNFWRVLIFSLAAAAIHPLAGLPAIALAALTAFKKYQTVLGLKMKRLIMTAIWLFSALAIPAALFLSSGADFKNIGSGPLFFSSCRNIIGTPNSAGREDFLINLVYLIANNYHLLIIILIIAALWIIRRTKNIASDFREKNNGLIFISTALLVAYFLSGQIVFDNVINYEQAGYANRLLTAIVIFLIPSIAVAIKNLIGRIAEQQLIVRILWIIFGLSLLSASLYISYPRFDKYFNSRGYSTSANDLAAVKEIAAEAEAPYIALANQQVSAAALRSFGFNHYYQTAAGELYFYPIPTGSPLYQYYLEMVYKNPGRESMSKALDLAGVDIGYLIINKYWYQSGRIINEAKLAADKWWTVNDQVFIFKYKR